MGKKSREKAERRRREEKALGLGAMYGVGSNGIRGHSHVPSPIKGVYNIGGTVTGRMSYNTVPTAWHTNIPKTNTFPTQAEEADRKMMELEMLKEFYGDSMCGDCISIKIVGGHDPKIHKRKKCQLCGTIWPGLEPDNDRRGAILAQREKKR